MLKHKPLFKACMVKISAAVTSWSTKPVPWSHVLPAAAASAAALVVAVAATVVAAAVAATVVVVAAVAAAAAVVVTAVAAVAVAATKPALCEQQAYSLHATHKKGPSGPFFMADFLKIDSELKNLAFPCVHHNTLLGHRPVLSAHTMAPEVIRPGRGQDGLKALSGLHCFILVLPGLPLKGNQRHVGNFP